MISHTFDPKEVLGLLESLLSEIPAESIQIDLSSRQRTLLRERILETMGRLQRLLEDLDPVKSPLHVLDPSDPEVVGRLIADTLLFQDRHRLDGLSRFYGSGIYALYYSGKFDAYRPASGTETPLYVGKADPAVHMATTPIQQGLRLWSRLSDHRKTINSADNLNVKDFDCRFLVVKSAWQNTAETYLIQRFLPIWNNEVGICYGFGKHGDDPKTRANTRSPWDTLHPGRKWATREGNLPYKLSPKEIKKQILAHYRKHPPSL
jgi:hypothetical protein